jgi:hypothetical protein
MTGGVWARAFAGFGAHVCNKKVTFAAVSVPRHGYIERTSISRVTLSGEHSIVREYPEGKEIVPPGAQEHVPLVQVKATPASLTTMVL